MIEDDSNVEWVVPINDLSRFKPEEILQIAGLFNISKFNEEMSATMAKQNKSYSISKKLWEALELASKNWLYIRQALEEKADPKDIDECVSVFKKACSIDLDKEKMTFLRIKSMKRLDRKKNCWKKGTEMKID